MKATAEDVLLSGPIDLLGLAQLTRQELHAGGFFEQDGDRTNLLNALSDRHRAMTGASGRPSPGPAAAARACPCSGLSTGSGTS